jgi:hypothetical protein
MKYESPITYQLKDTTNTRVLADGQAINYDAPYLSIRDIKTIAAEFRYQIQNPLTPLICKCFNL